MNLLLATLLALQTAFAPLLGAHEWTGGKPAPQAFAGKVVIVDVFTYSCINCKHVVPGLQKLRARYGSGDLLIVGIHTPELPFEHVHANVVRNLALQGITWPVAFDDTQTLWNAYGIQYWPTQLIYDRHGVLRKTVVGEGQDDLVASTVAALIARK